MENKKLEKALKKRALGCKVVESVEEYGIVDGALSLVKQKIMKKDVPPDVTALKILMELKTDDEIDNMSEEELQAEKQRLLALLCEKSDSEKSESEGTE